MADYDHPQDINPELNLFLVPRWAPIRRVPDRLCLRKKNNNQTSTFKIKFKYMSGEKCRHNVRYFSFVRTFFKGLTNKRYI